MNQFNEWMDEWMNRWIDDPCIKISRSIIKVSKWISG